MSETSNERLLERQIGITSECIILGLVALLTLASFLSIIGNPLTDSLLMGAVLGVAVGGIRYLGGVAVGQLRHLITNQKA